MKMEIYVGARGYTDNTIDNAECYQVLRTPWPVPRIGDHITGRNTKGQQYGAEVLWVTHMFELNTIRVYARQS